MNKTLELVNVGKSFRLHLQGGLELPVVHNVSFSAEPGRCVTLVGPSGAGKSSVIKMIFGSYRCETGSILLRDRDSVIDIARSEPRAIIALRRSVIGYVSQFLRAVPRVPAIDVVAEPLVLSGLPRAQAQARARDLLRRLNIPERLWGLPPATFSGGEQQRINIARGFLADLPILLLDEPTASLDADNRAVVVDLIAEKKRCGTTLVAVVHDKEVQTAISDTSIDVSRFSAAK